MDQSLSPKKSHAQFLTLKIFNIKNIKCLGLFIHYNLNLSILHLVVILTILETPKNTFLDCTLFAEQCSQDQYYPKKSLLKSSHQKKILAKFSYPKKSRNGKFQTQKNPSIISVTWNPEYPPPPGHKWNIQKIKGWQQSNPLRNYFWSPFWKSCLEGVRGYEMALRW